MYGRTLGSKTFGCGTEGSAGSCALLKLAITIMLKQRNDILLIIFFMIRMLKIALKEKCIFYNYIKETCK